MTLGLAVSCSILPVHISYNEIGQSYKFSTLVSTLHRLYLFSLYHLTFGRFCPKVCHFILNRIILDYLILRYMRTGLEKQNWRGGFREHRINSGPNLLTLQYQLHLVVHLHSYHLLHRNYYQV